jgi:hypothetical protein
MGRRLGCSIGERAGRIRRPGTDRSVHCRATVATKIGGRELSLAADPAAWKAGQPYTAGHLTTGGGTVVYGQPGPTEFSGEERGGIPGDHREGGPVRGLLHHRVLPLADESAGTLPSGRAQQ